MVSWEITKEEIESLWQFFELQGGSKYRQKEGQKLLDRIMARDPLPGKDSAKPEVPKMPATTLICPYCMTENKFEQYQCVASCTKCGSPIFRGPVK